MSKTKEFLDNFENRWSDSYIDRLRQEIEFEEQEWFLYQKELDENKRRWVEAATNLNTWNG